MATTMGAATGIFAIFFLGDVPRIREDILMNIPIIGSYWDRLIAPEDNVCLSPDYLAAINFHFHIILV